MNQKTYNKFATGSKKLFRLQQNFFIKYITKLKSVKKLIEKNRNLARFLLESNNHITLDFVLNFLLLKLTENLTAADKPQTSL